jgi:hypothetical protein
MHLNFRNVNDAFATLMTGLARDTIPHSKTESRNGDCLRLLSPITMTYSYPWERVLWNVGRDANPFFHLYEALWMLGGNKSIAPLVWFVPRFKEFSDDGETMHAAYGYRWRKTWTDQLDVIIRHLQKDRNSRRAVLTMWDPHDMERVLWKPGMKDVACNTHAYFDIQHDQLHMTVMNRSNDILWGALGANYVHFSFLQEYMASMIGVEMGKYNHFTNNLHLYCVREDFKKWFPPKGQPRDWYTTLEDGALAISEQTRRHFPLISSRGVFDKELPILNTYVYDLIAHGEEAPNVKFDEPFLETVAKPLLFGWMHHKLGNHQDALENVHQIAATDWRIACVDWLKRHEPKAKKEARSEPRSLLTDSSKHAAEETT